MIRNRIPLATEKRVLEAVVYEGMTQREAASRFEIGLATVNGVMARNGWRAVGSRTIWEHECGERVPADQLSPTP